VKFPHQWWVIYGQSKMGWAFPHHAFQWRQHIICNKLFSSIPNLKGSVLANPTNMLMPPIDPTLQTTLAPVF